MKPLKKALTYEQQIEHLKNSHGLEIPNLDSALNILKRVNYYRLSAYGIGLKKDSDPEMFQDGISIDYLFDLYSFDSSFRSLVLHTVEQIEIQLRTQIAYYLSLKYGAEGYLNPDNFITKVKKDGTDIHSSVIASFRNECKRQNKVPFVIHHNEQYGGHFPLWVAIELFSFGNLSSLLDIMKDEDKKQIAALYNTEPKYLKSWVLSLVEVRNICAHYSRLYNMPLKQTPFLYSEYREFRNERINKIFPVLLVIKRMLADNQELWDSFFIDLCSLIKDYSNVLNLSFIGFPTNWKSVLSK
jgi:abortive infection bacteriophage resistance protein